MANELLGKGALREASQATQSPRKDLVSCMVVKVGCLVVKVSVTSICL